MANKQKRVDTYDTISLHAFIECMLNGTIAPEIWEEFVYNISDTEQQYAKRLMQEINVLTSKYNQANLILQFMQIEEKLSGHGVVLQEESEAVWTVLTSLLPVKKGEKLAIIANRARRLLADKMEKEAELQGIQTKEEGGTVNRAYFTRMVAVVSSFHKMQINRRQMALAEFVELYLMLREHNDEIERQRNTTKK